MVTATAGVLLALAGGVLLYLAAPNQRLRARGGGWPALAHTAQSGDPQSGRSPSDISRSARSM